MAENGDRRVRRTRRALRAALVALITERGYDRVTVQDVLDRADVGRSTFYAHFRDKEALFSSCFDDLRDDLQRSLGPQAGPPPDAPRAIAMIFEHADRNQAFYRAVGVTHLHRLIHDVLLDHFTGHRMQLPAEIVAEFHAGALVGVLAWWVRAGFPRRPAEMAEICHELIHPGAVAAGIGAKIGE